MKLCILLALLLVVTADVKKHEALVDVSMEEGSCDDRLERMAKNWRELRMMYGEMHCKVHGVGEVRSGIYVNVLNGLTWLSDSDRAMYGKQPVISSPCFAKPMQSMRRS